MSLVAPEPPIQTTSPKTAVRSERPSRRTSPDVLVIGGGSNALSIARLLGRRGIKVHAINKPEATVFGSRYAKRIPLPHSENYKQQWTEFLLGPVSDQYKGSVLLAASDVGLEIIAENRTALQRRFLLDESDPQAQLSMLDKLVTYDIALRAGVPTPRFWKIQKREDLEKVREDLVFPLLVKPKSSYAFTDRFKGKFFVADNMQQVDEGCDRLIEAGVEFLLMEKIPGPDSLLCSYYTYLDHDGVPQFHFTKRIIRRNPPNMGLGCYHITDWNPEVRDVALKLFQAVGLRGLANAEFKLDERDGTLKLIECNARFTEANGLVAKSGFDLASFVYNRITGLPQQPLKKYRRGVRLWYPFDDFRSFLALKRQRKIGLWSWLRSICHRQMFPLFSWTDPMPSLTAMVRRFRSLFKSKRTKRNPAPIVSERRKPRTEKQNYTY